VGNASLLEASRRSWKEGGARSQEGYKGTQSAESVSRVEVLVVLVLVLVGRCACVEVGVCGEAVRGATRSLELAVGGGPGVAKETRAGGAALLCRANLRVHVRRAAESSPAMRKARAQPRLH